MKEMPERIYLFDCNDAMTTPLEGDTEYIRKDSFIKKASKWLVDNISKYVSAIKGADVIAVDCKLFDDFKEFVEEQV